MGQYKVNIELVFESKEQSENILSACESIFDRANPIIRSEVLKAAQTEILKVSDDMTNLLPKMYANQLDANRLVIETNKALELTQSEVKQAEDAVKQLKETHNQASNRLYALKDFVTQIKDSKDKQSKISKEIDEQIKRAQALKDAIKMINDCLETGSILVGGSAQMLQKDGSGRFELIRGVNVK